MKIELEVFTYSTGESLWHINFDCPGVDCEEGLTSNVVYDDPKTAELAGKETAKKLADLFGGNLNNLEVRWTTGGTQ
jgi:hypothetical protein